MKRLVAAAAIAALMLAARPVAGQAPEGALAHMPVREVTVFKDGHAFVLHEGVVPVEDAGEGRSVVTLDYLPAPVLGTFWPYVAEKGATLESVTSGRQVVARERTALTIPELVRANVGRRALIRESTAPAAPFEATILGIPTRSSEELARLAGPAATPSVPQESDLVMLGVAGGTRVMPISRIDQLVFLESPAAETAVPELRDVMQLRVAWDKAPAKEARVGMMYLQRGIRWIPEYRVEIDGGKARIRLQATIINELVDLEGVKLHLVIGVPSFAFQDQLDPISLQQAVAQLSQHFRNDSQTAFALSNAIMSQRAYSVEERRPRPSGPTLDLGPEGAEAGGQKREDLYVFDLAGVTLARGQRMVIPIAEFEIPYRDVYVLDLPFAPPPEVRQRFDSSQQQQLAKLYASPKARHVLRLTNTSGAPLTTAPAMILRDGRLIAQGMMTYTSPGAVSDLDLTTAVDVAIHTSEEEAGRTPNAANWHGNSFDRIDLTGSIRVTNQQDRPIELEVNRQVLGLMDQVGQGGQGRQMGFFEAGFDLPYWWSWYNWPYWWYRFNGLGRATWNLSIEPGEKVELTYSWHYFWG